MLNGYRPALPPDLYPSLAALIGDCWKKEPRERPNFDDIVRRLLGEVAEEVQNMPEPDITIEDENDEQVALHRLSMQHARRSRGKSMLSISAREREAGILARQGQRCAAGRDSDHQR
jgi:hypothetical protein